MADKYDDAAMAKVVKPCKLPPETALSIKEGSLVYRAVACAIANVAGVDVILVAKNKPALQIAFNKITNGAEYSLAKVHNVVIAQEAAVTLDDEL